MPTITTDDSDRAYTVDDTCIRLGGISRSALYGLIRTGQLVAHKVGSRTVIRQAEITRFLDSLPVVDTEG